MVAVMAKKGSPSPLVSQSVYQLDIFADMSRAVSTSPPVERKSEGVSRGGGGNRGKGSVKKGVVDIVWNEDKKLVAVFWQCVMDRKEDELLRVNKAMTQYWEAEQYRVVIRTIVELLSYVERNWLVGVMKSCL